ncbi:FAD-dependent oxidoreductase [Gaiella sp.]|uniref:NAD(P)/FAD-dependent oxidoreductase n=1 Tax=Gaiella sp. TaxID=2663207 RepID=UPI002E36FE9D|nr:FAD-dependent oxidoreductase [Gaiella sp.]HEX5582090.1 FAD-dependent oxidoreductase [Gaiella sp.]
MTTPYWLDEPARELPGGGAGGHVDVGIVGAGVTGCACALVLAQSGVSVRVVDERRIAEGASGRNGGFALRGTAAPYDEVVASVGRERALALWRWTESEIDALEELAGDAFRRVGSLRLAVGGEEREDLRDEIEGLWADGLDAEWIDAPGGALAGRFTAAIRHPTDGVLQPARWVRRLAGLAADAGAEFVEGRRVADPDELDADTVVVATDGYPSGLLGELEGLIVPTRGQVVATEPLAERLFEVPHYGRHGFDYWHQAADGRLVAGGFRDVALEQEFTADEAVTDDVQGSLERFVNELVGRTLRIDYRWAGIFGLVLDFLPVVGPAPGQPATWVAAGYSGHGNVLGFACGRLVARAIVGDRDPLLDLFEPARLLGT